MVANHPCVDGNSFLYEFQLYTWIQDVIHILAFFTTSYERQALQMQLTYTGNELKATK